MLCVNFVFAWLCCYLLNVQMMWVLLFKKGIYFACFWMFSGEDSQERDRIESIRLNNTLSFPGSSPTYMEQNNDNGIISSTQNYVESNQSRLQPPAFFTGYTLPPGNPCETFTLPPPPADKKRTGPRRKFGFSSQICFAASINCFCEIANYHVVLAFVTCYQGFILICITMATKIDILVTK